MITRARFWGLLAAAALVMVLAGSLPRAVAEPPPLEEEQLRAESDLIVEGRVLSVENTGYADFHAMVRIEKTLKGRPPSNPMRYAWVPPEPGIIGEMNHNVFAGQRVRLYLVFERGRYIPWASNSVEWLEAVPDAQRILPQEPGEVIYADGITREGHCCRCRRRWRRR